MIVAPSYDSTLPSMNIKTLPLPFPVNKGEGWENKQLYSCRRVNKTQGRGQERSLDTREPLAEEEDNNINSKPSIS